jgi:hypothetical protein
MKYSEQQGKEVFDWNLALDDAIKNGVIKERHEYLDHLSGSWITCACGNQCASLPRFSKGEPMDMSLAYLGEDFMDLIENKNFIEAKEILAKIEERTIVLLSQQS